MSISGHHLLKRHTEVFEQREYLNSAGKKQYICIDDESHPHNKLGFQKFTKSKNKEAIKAYHRKKNHIQKMTWKELLCMENLREHFEWIEISSIKPSFPLSYENYVGGYNKLPNKVGVFKYTKPLRFGGCIDSETQRFYVFWIDQKNDDLYNHTQ